MESTYLYFLFGILAVAVPVIIIFMTLSYVRKKRETGSERSQREQHPKGDMKDQLKSVEEERIEKKGRDKTNN